MTKRPRRTQMLPALALCLGLLTPAAVHAQSPSAQTAREAKLLYNQAIADLDAKRYERACRKLEEVTRLLPDAAGAKLTLAECYERLEKTASAWSLYTLAAVMDAKAGKAARAKAAKRSAATLRSRLATLAIEVPTTVRSIPGLAITCDGLLVGEAQWGEPLPVDPGEYEVVVTAPNRKPWKGRVEIARNGVTVTLTVKSLEVNSKAGASRIPAPLPATQETAGSVRIPMLVLGTAVTAVGLGMGVKFTLAANGKSDVGAGLRKESGLGASTCHDKPPEALAPACNQLQNEMADLKTFSNVAFWSFVGGGATGIATAIYGLTSRTSPAKSPAAAMLVAPVIGNGQAGVILIGTW